MPYLINGQSLEINDPQEQNGITYVPLAPVIDGLGGTVKWDNQNKLASITLGGHVASVGNDSEQAGVDGNPVPLSGPPYLDQNHIYVPLDFLQALGATASSDGTTITINAS